MNTLARPKWVIELHAVGVELAGERVRIVLEVLVVLPSRPVLEVVEEAIRYWIPRQVLIIWITHNRCDSLNYRNILKGALLAGRIPR